MEEKKIKCSDKKIEKYINILKNNGYFVIQRAEIKDLMNSPNKLVLEYKKMKEQKIETKKRELMRKFENIVNLKNRYAPGKYLLHAKTIKNNNISKEYLKLAKELFKNYEIKEEIKEMETKISYFSTEIIKTHCVYIIFPKIK